MKKPAWWPSRHADVQKPSLPTTSWTADDTAPQIRQPALWYATQHPLYEYDPHEHLSELEQRVADAVARMAESGVDEANLDALHHRIARWGETWKPHIHEHAERRRHSTLTLLAQAQQNMVLVRERERRLDLRVRDLQARREAFLESHGYRLRPADAAPASVEGTVIARHSRRPTPADAGAVTHLEPSAEADDAHEQRDAADAEDAA